MRGLNLGRAIRRLVREGTARPSREEGVGLVEVLVTAAIVSMTFVTLLTALSTSTLAVNRADRRITAESLARSQMEYAKAQPYQVAPATYDVMAPLPTGYTVSAEASAISGRDADVQKLTVTVSYQGETVVVLEDFKANR